MSFVLSANTEAAMASHLEKTLLSYGVGHQDVITMEITSAAVTVMNATNSNRYTDSKKNLDKTLGNGTNH